MNTLVAQERQPDESDTPRIEHNMRIPVKMFEPGDNHNQPLEAGPALSELVDLYATAALEKKVVFTLIWPGTLESLPLVHSLACFKLWADSTPSSLRGLYYPGKRNTFYPLNRVFVSKNSLEELGSQLLSTQPSQLSSGTADSLALQSKGVILLAVNSMRAELEEAEVRPCINELIPHFVREFDDESFKDYTERFYFRVRSKLADAAHKKALKKCTFPEVSSPGTAPDGLFSLGHSLSNESIDAALKEMKKVGPPHVVVLDATRKSVRSIPDWRQRFFKFINSVRRTFRDNAPGILFVTDEPQQLALFRAMLTNETSGLIKRTSVETYGILHARNSLGLQPPGERHEARAAQGIIKVVVTDQEVGVLMDALYKAYTELRSDIDEASIITDVMSFLVRLSQLPGSIQAMWQYLGELGIDAQTRDGFDWKSYRTKLRQLVESGRAGDLRNRLETLLSQCDKVVAAYENQTPLGAALLNEIAVSNAARQRTTIVVGRNFNREVLSRFLSAQAIDAECINVALVDGLGQLVAESSCDRAIFADMSPSILRAISTQQNLPPHTTVVLATPVAKQLYHAILPLLELQAFTPFWPRLNQVASVIRERLANGPEMLWTQDRAWQSSFKLSFSENADDEPGIEDREAVLIETTGPLIRRGLHSTVYVYNALEAADGHSGFRAKEASKIVKGDEIVVVSAELREAAQLVLAAAGWKSNFASTFEEGLRSYHARISQQLNTCFKSHKGQRAGQLRMLRDRIAEASPDLEPELSNISYWVNLESIKEKSFAEITTQAPRSFKAFKAFCHALRVEEFEALMYWNLIQDMRKARRADGRWVSDAYTRLLFDEAEAVAYSRVPIETIRELRRGVADCVYTVTEVLLPA